MAEGQRSSKELACIQASEAIEEICSKRYPPEHYSRRERLANNLKGEQLSENEVERLLSVFDGVEKLTHDRHVAHILQFGTAERSVCRFHLYQQHLAYIEAQHGVQIDTDEIPGIREQIRDPTYRLTKSPASSTSAPLLTFPVTQFAYRPCADKPKAAASTPVAKVTAQCLSQSLAQMDHSRTDKVIRKREDAKKKA